MSDNSNLKNVSQNLEQDAKLQVTEMENPDAKSKTKKSKKRSRRFKKLKIIATFLALWCCYCCFISPLPNNKLDRNNRQIYPADMKESEVSPDDTPNYFIYFNRTQKLGSDEENGAHYLVKALGTKTFDKPQKLFGKYNPEDTGRFSSVYESKEEADLYKKMRENITGYLGLKNWNPYDRFRNSIDLRDEIFAEGSQNFPSHFNKKQIQQIKESLKTGKISAEFLTTVRKIAASYVHPLRKEVFDKLSDNDKAQKLENFNREKQYYLALKASLSEMEPAQRAAAIEESFQNELKMRSEFVINYYDFEEKRSPSHNEYFEALPDSLNKLPDAENRSRGTSCPLLIAIILHNSKPLNLLSQASKCKYYWMPNFPLDPKNMDPGMEFNSFQFMSQCIAFSKIWTNRARVKCQLGLWQEGLDDLFDLQRLARLMSNKNVSLIDNLVPQSMFNISQDTILNLCVTEKIPAEQLRRIIRKYDDGIANQIYDSIIDCCAHGEKYRMLKLIFGLKRGAFMESRLITASSSEAYKKMAKTIDWPDLIENCLATQNKAYMKLEISSKDGAQIQTNDNEYELSLIETTKAYSFFLQSLDVIPFIPRAQRSRIRTNYILKVFKQFICRRFPITLLKETKVKSQFCSIIAALELYKLKNGKYPDSLEQLTVFAKNKKLFNDPFTAKLFLYKLTDSGKYYKIWSKGFNHIDNAGHGLNCQERNCPKCKGYCPHRDCRACRDDRLKENDDVMFTNKPAYLEPHNLECSQNHNQ